MQHFIRCVAFVGLLTWSIPINAATDLQNRGSVLILGDSHMYGSFGRQLHQLVSQKLNMETHTYAICPSTPESYYRSNLVGECGIRVRRSLFPDLSQVFTENSIPKEKTFENILSDIQPRLVLISLGTNLGRHNASQIKSSAQNLVASIKANLPSSTIFWIGPPNYKGSNRIKNSLALAIANLPNVAYLDATHFNEKDPLPTMNPHFPPYLAAKWADYAFSNLIDFMKNRPLQTEPKSKTKLVLRQVSLTRPLVLAASPVRISLLISSVSKVNQ